MVVMQGFYLSRDCHSTLDETMQQHDFSVSTHRRYEAFVAMNESTLEEVYALRYRVFAQELGARLKCEGDLDMDELDPYCDHLVVRDNGTGAVVGGTRLLSDRAAERLGYFYSEKEFDLGAVLSFPGRFLEVGRTCVDPDSRGGVVLSVLWSALAKYANERGFDYLMGCASVPPGPSGYAIDAFYRQLQPEQIGPDWLAVASRKPVPAEQHCHRDESGIPPLLQTYLRFGAWVCGEPFWDEDFNVMDVFILLPMANLRSRYAKRFIREGQKRGRLERV